MSETARAETRRTVYVHAVSSGDTSNTEQKRTKPVNAVWTEFELAATSIKIQMLCL